MITITANCSMPSANALYWQVRQTNPGVWTNFYVLPPNSVPMTFQVQAGYLVDLTSVNGADAVGGAQRTYGTILSTSVSDGTAGRLNVIRLGSGGNTTWSASPSTAAPVVWAEPAVTASEGFPSWFWITAEDSAVWFMKGFSSVFSAWLAVYLMRWAVRVMFTRGNPGE